METLARTQEQEQTSDTESESNDSSGEELEHEVNQLMCDIFGDDAGSEGVTEYSFWLHK